MKRLIRNTILVVFILFTSGSIKALCASGMILHNDKPINSNICICVGNQRQFNSIQDTILTVASRGYKKIVVRIKPGDYYYNHKHILFEKRDFSDIDLVIDGSNCRIISNKKTKKEERFILNNAFVTNDLKDFNYWSSIYHTDTLLQVVDKHKKLCLARSNKLYKDSITATPYTYLQITQWYNSSIYKVEKIEEDKVFFTAHDLKTVNEDYNINYDYILKGELPRFRLCNIESPHGKYNRNNPDIKELNAGSFIVCEESSFNSFTIKGLSFIGNTSNHLFISLKNSFFNKKCQVINCCFSSMRGGVIDVMSTDNIIIKNCSFFDNYDAIVRIDNNCRNVVIQGNFFNRCGLALKCSCCVHCEGDNYIIKDNKFVDFGYCAIRCGVWYQDRQVNPSSGVVEHNVLYYTRKYLSEIDEHGLIDGGAIYIATKNDKVLVRYNYIHDISGFGANRGIYCDDGAYNFTLCGNIILNIYKGRCIDARFDPALERIDKSQSSNFNKVMRANIFDGDIKFQGKPSSQNGCIKGANYVNAATKTKAVYDYSNLDIQSEDILINILKVKDNKMVVDRKTKKILKSSAVYNEIKRYIDI